MKHFLTLAALVALSWSSAMRLEAGRDVLYVTGFELNQFNQATRFVRLYDANTGSILANNFIANPSSIGPVTVADGKLFLLDYSGNLAVYDAASGAVINPSLL